MLNLRLSDSPCSKPNSKPTQQQPGIARVLYIIMWQLCCTQHPKYQDHNVYQQQALKETGNEYPQSLVFASVSVLHIIIAGGVLYAHIISHDHDIVHWAVVGQP